jgi:ABC-2 type transport system ATP-binding protein
VPGVAPPAIVAEQLRRAFGDTVAVDGVDLAVERGEIYGFLGPNGAGKSTTVRMLCTLLAPTGGRAVVGGHDVATDPGAVRLQIGVALQDAALDEQQTGRELLTLQARLFGLRRNEVQERVDELTSFIDIGDALDRRIKTYSGGMKRRLDLAAALVHNPDVLFLDEPTTGLDPVSRTRVWEEVRRLNDELGMTIFLTTQYLEEADELADRVGIIDRGRIVAEDTPAALKRALGADVIVARVEGDASRVCDTIERLPGIEQVRIDGDTVTVRATHGDEAIGPVAVALHDCGVAIQNLTLRTPTLDDVFLERTGGHLQEDDE